MKSPENRGGKRLDRGVQTAIGRKLRESYQEVADAPVPQRFLELLDRLEQGETVQQADRETTDGTGPGG